ncbi:glycosyl hydrolase family 25 [Candidatus Saccharibacteria bacterium]|nr:glycosyl hydrolase family 25 [Candidatus Saccharibacteria bacterium]
MGKRIGLVVTFIFFMALAVIATSFFFLVKNKQILVNPWFVSRDKDTIGVDISHYQGTVDLEKLASQNIKFVYFKATEGSSYKDEHFRENWDKAQDSKIKEKMLFGAYHFFSLESSGEDQANNYISTVGDLTGNLVPVVDFELYGDYLNNPPKKEYVVSKLRSLLDALEAQYLTKPMIYSEIDVYNHYLAEDFSDYPLWLRSVYYPIDWKFRDDWTMWQYTDRGELEGYTEEKYIDLNKLNPAKSLNNYVVK